MLLSFLKKSIITYNIRENVVIEWKAIVRSEGAEVMYDMKKKKRVTVYHIGMGHWVQTYPSNVTPSPYELRHVKNELFLVQLVLCRPKYWRESGFRQFFAAESGILSFGFRNTAQGIRNPFNDWNLESKFHWQRIQNPVTRTRNSRRGIQNPRLSWSRL